MASRSGSPPGEEERASTPIGQEHFERVDWKKVVFALTEYAHRRLGPGATWLDAQRYARVILTFALDPAEETWDPREDTLIHHLGHTLREVILEQRRQDGDEIGPLVDADWSVAKRGTTVAELRAAVPGPAGLPRSMADVFRARRRIDRTARDVVARQKRERS